MPIPFGYRELLHIPRAPNGIETVWTSHSGQHLVLPDGRGDIILRFNISENSPVLPIILVVAGPSTSFHYATLTPDLYFIGARLRPGFLERILNITAVSLRNRVLVGDAALAAVPALLPLTAPASSIDELVSRLNSFVHEQLSNLSPRLGANKSLDLIDTVHTGGGRLSIMDLSKMHDVSARTVHRQIVQATGLAPKELNQILQFHRALRLLRDHRLKPAEAAFEAGYSDQAHMTRAFRKLGGFTPAQLPDLVLATLPS
jgi:AraC-like DNA-binding protein